jgi:pheromone shutdown protein TraB
MSGTAESSATQSVSRRLDALSERDPRLSREHVRVVDGKNPVVLVGVVHDHPASVFRARTIVEELEPGTVALEIPDALVPKFESYAETGSDEGGEMTAAVEAASGSVVGIDAPSARSFGELARQLLRERASPETAWEAVSISSRLVAQTFRDRLAIAGVGEPTNGAFAESYECSSADSPGVQADHENGHVRRSTTLLRAFEVPAATRILDSARERAMGKRLRALRRTHPVVAVVGYSHVESVAETLTG